MKSIIATITLITTLSSFASSSLKSRNLEGQYELVKASSDFAKAYHCSQEIEVRVNESLVVLDGLSDNKSHSAFYAEDEGCEKSKGDIGPIRKKCTRFKKKSVSYSDTSYITIAGFIREYTTIKLDGKKGDKLIYSNNITQVPLGILGINKDDEFKCEYKRK